MKTAPVQLDTPINKARNGRTRSASSASSFASQLRSLVDSDQAALPSAADILGRVSGLRPLTPLEMIRGIKGPARPLSPLNEASAAALLPMTEADQVSGVRKKQDAQEDQVQATARKWLAQTFYGTMLRQMRQSPFKSDLFEGGRGGQAFSTLLDQHLADHMARSTDKRLAGAIAKRIMKGKTAAGSEIKAQSGRRKDEKRDGSLLSPQSTIGNRQSAIPGLSAQDSGLISPRTQDLNHVTPGLRA